MRPEKARLVMVYRRNQWNWPSSKFRLRGLHCESRVTAVDYRQSDDRGYIKGRTTGRPAARCVDDVVPKH